jgi:hypothetical protein
MAFTLLVSTGMRASTTERDLAETDIEESFFREGDAVESSSSSSDSWDDLEGEAARPPSFWSRVFLPRGRRAATEPGCALPPPPPSSPRATTSPPVRGDDEEDWDWQVAIARARMS